MVLFFSVLLFVDEADAFLRKRSKVSFLDNSLNSALLTTLVYNTLKTQSPIFQSASGVVECTLVTVALLTQTPQKFVKPKMMTVPFSERS